MSSKLEIDNNLEQDDFSGVDSDEWVCLFIIMKIIILII